MPGEVPNDQRHWVGIREKKPMAKHNNRSAESECW